MPTLSDKYIINRTSLVAIGDALRNKLQDSEKTFSPDDMASTITEKLGVTERRIVLKNSGSSVACYAEYEGTKYYTSGQQILATDGDTIKFVVNSSGAVYLNGVEQPVTGARYKEFNWIVDSDISVLFDTTHGGTYYIRLGKSGYVYNQSKTAVSSGSISTDDGYDGLSTVTIDIPAYNGLIIRPTPPEVHYTVTIEGTGAAQGPSGTEYGAYVRYNGITYTTPTTIQVGQNESLICYAYYGGTNRITYNGTNYNPPEHEFIFGQDISQDVTVTLDYSVGSYAYVDITNS